MSISSPGRAAVVAPRTDSRTSTRADAPAARSSPPGAPGFHFSRRAMIESAGSGCRARPRPARGTAVAGAAELDVGARPPRGPRFSCGRRRSRTGAGRPGRRRRSGRGPSVKVAGGDRRRRGCRGAAGARLGAQRGRGAPPRAGGGGGRRHGGGRRGCTATTAERGRCQSRSDGRPGVIHDGAVRRPRRAAASSHARATAAERTGLRARRPRPDSQPGPPLQPL